MRIFLIGFMGSGKSHWGRLLSQRLQLPYYDLDALIVESAGKPITSIFEEEGEEYFRLLEKDLLEDVIRENPSLVLSCGGGTPCFFNNIELMKKEGLVVWLNTETNTLLARLQKEKAKRPLIKDISEAELRSYILKKINDRRIYYEQADLHIEEDKINLEELIQLIMHA